MSIKSSCSFGALHFSGCCHHILFRTNGPSHTTTHNLQNVSPFRNEPASVTEPPNTESRVLSSLHEHQRETCLFSCSRGVAKYIPCLLSPFLCVRSPTAPANAQIVHSGAACNVNDDNVSERIYTIKEGDTLVLQCIVKGHPRPQVSCQSDPLLFFAHSASRYLKSFCTALKLEP